jgi:hypothetical protein
MGCITPKEKDVDNQSGLPSIMRKQYKLRGEWDPELKAIFDKETFEDCAQWTTNTLSIQRNYYSDPPKSETL